MATIHFHETTTATPEQFVAGLTDFGPGRSKLFGNSADDYLKVHDQGPTEADVTEGSGGVWERLHYDWSDPNRVVMTTTDSNAWGGASGHTYTFTRQPDGTTDVDVVVVREGKNLKGRLARARARDRRQGPSWQRRSQTPSRRSRPGRTAPTENAADEDGRPRSAAAATTARDRGPGPRAGRTRRRTRPAPRPRTPRKSTRARRAPAYGPPPGGRASRHGPRASPQPS